MTNRSGWDTDRWIAALREHLPRHAEALARLVAGVRSDGRWRWLELGCSVAGGRGDAWSDLDLGLGAAVSPGAGTGGGSDEPDGPLPVAAARHLVAGCGEVVDLLVHELPGRTTPHARIAAELASGVQIDLVVIPAGVRPGLPPGSLALVDRDGVLARPWRPESAGPPSGERAREWAFLGWWALSDVAKYLARGSVFEAADRLGEARDLTLRLHAAALGIAYPGFGLTSLLDEPEPDLPAGLAATVAPADGPALRRAALVLADILADAAARAGLTLGADLAPALSRPVRQRLAPPPDGSGDRPGQRGSDPLTPEPGDTLGGRPPG